MFNSINLNDLPNFSIEEIDKKVSSIADHIENNLDFRVEQSCLEVLNQTRHGVPTLEVLNSLRKITQVALEKGLYETLKMKLKIISNFCKEIIVAHPNFQLAEDLSPEMLCKILSYTNSKDLEGISTVAKFWKEAASYHQIKAIDEGKLKLNELLKGFTAMEAVKWITNQYSKDLQYADFSGFYDFDNDCLEKLTKQCPNLKHLIIPSSKIQGGALKYLQQTPKLEILNIAWCNQLELDALKHLQYTPQLQSLNIASCTKLERDALKHLQNTPQLHSLNIASCAKLEGDALKHLQYAKQLQNLNITSCLKLEQDALKHLKYTPQLENLNMGSCYQLEKDMLKHLQNISQLKNLDIHQCSQLERDALKHLQYTPQLLSLNISSCDLLEQDTLKHLKYISQLQSLNINSCSLEKDALKHLQYTPQLQSLSIVWCYNLERDALKHLQYTPQLQNLDIGLYSQIDKCCLPNHLKL